MFIRTIEKINKEKLFKYSLIAVIMIGILLRFVTLGSKSLWFDEAHTFEDSLDLTYKAWKNPHVLYFSMVKFFLLFGHSEFWLRLTSAIFGSLGLITVYFAGKEVYRDRRVGFLCTLFTTFSSVHFAYSQEARYYSVMFFLSAAIIFLFAKFINTKNLLYLGFLPVISFINYLIHPTSIVLSGVMLGWIPIALCMTKEGREIITAVKTFLFSLFSSDTYLKDDKKKKMKKKNRKNLTFMKTIPGKVLIFVIMIIVLSIGTWAALKIFKAAASNMGQVKLFKAPASGVYFTRQFFFSNYQYFGANVSPSGIFNIFVTALFTIFTITGYLKTIIKRPAFGVFFILCISAVITLLFSVPIKQEYSPKYIMFIYPCAIIPAMYGVIVLIDFFKKNIFSKFPGQQAIFLIIIYSVFILPQIFANFISLKKYLSGEWNDVKGAFKLCVDDVKSDSGNLIAAYNLTSLLAKYYVEYYNIPKSQYVDLAFEKGDGSRAVRTLVKKASKGKNLYIVWAWGHDVRSELQDFIKKNFDLVHKTPSLWESVYDSYLWKWKYTNKMINNQTMLNLDFNLTKDDKGLYSGFSEVFAEYDMKAVLQPKQSENLIPAGYKLQLFEDEIEIAIPQSGDINFALPFGSHVIKTVVAQDQSVSADIKNNPNNMQLQYTLKSINPGILYINAGDYDEASKTDDILVKTEQNLTYLRMPYNGFTSYKIHSDETKNYLLGINAKNHAPGPITYQIEIDDSPVGILSYQSADSKWETKYFPIELTKGEHRLSIYFISDVFVGKNDRPGDNDSFLSTITLSEIIQGAELPPDGRVLIPKDKTVKLSDYLPEKDFTISSDKPWRVDNYQKSTNSRIRVGDYDYDAFSAEIPFDLKAANLISPPIKVTPGQLLYFSAKCSVEDLNNHTANILVAFLDKNEKLFYQQWINGQGIMKTVSDVKFISLLSIPPQTETIVISCSVYANSNKPYTNTGKVCFYDFKTEKDLMK